MVFLRLKLRLKRRNAWFWRFKQRFKHRNASGFGVFDISGTRGLSTEVRISNPHTEYSRTVDDEKYFGQTSLFRTEVRISAVTAEVPDAAAVLFLFVHGVFILLSTAFFK